MKIIVELSPPRRDEILQLVSKHLLTSIKSRIWYPYNYREPPPSHTCIQIKQLPFGSTRHVFTRKSFPDSDLVYYQFLRKMGFGDSAGHLEFTGDADALELLGAGLTAVLASKMHWMEPCWLDIEWTTIRLISDKIFILGLEILTLWIFIIIADKKHTWLMASTL